MVELIKSIRSAALAAAEGEPGPLIRTRFVAKIFTLHHRSEK